MLLPTCPFNVLQTLLGYRSVIDAEKHTHLLGGFKQDRRLVLWYPPPPHTHMHTQATNSLLYRRETISKHTPPLLAPLVVLFVCPVCTMLVLIDGGPVYGCSCFNCNIMLFLGVERRRPRNIRYTIVGATVQCFQDSRSWRSAVEGTPAQSFVVSLHRILRVFLFS